MESDEDEDEVVAAGVLLALSDEAVVLVLPSLEAESDFAPSDFEESAVSDALFEDVPFL